jgi:hypothetical protein
MGRRRVSLPLSDEVGEGVCTHARKTSRASLSKIRMSSVILVKVELVQQRLFGHVHILACHRHRADPAPQLVGTPGLAKALAT